MERTKEEWRVCCDNCDFYKDAICHLWIAGDTECIEEIENPETQVCSNWEMEAKE